MGLEIDFLAVGDESQSGDAIALRWGDLHGSRENQWVAIVDGGFKEIGNKLVDFVKTRYGTDLVDIVLSTHPDEDHANGLIVVLEELQVGTLLMHQPWKHEHTNNIADMFKSGRVTDQSVRAHLRKSLDAAADLEALAKKKGIKIVEPFSGVHTPDGTFKILGPTKDFYQSLLPNFRGTPEPKSVFATGLEDIFKKAADSVTNFIDETFGFETLTDEGETSPENNSSSISLLTVDGKSYILTGDAGQPALLQVADFLDADGFDKDTLKLIQVPHHGSRRNVGPTVLNRLLGKPNSEDKKTRSAFLSAAKKGEPKHPSRKVANAFRRRGAYMYTTQGVNLWHHEDAPDRSDYSSATPLAFYSEVEE